MDNKKTLKKILEELNQEKPRIDYIKGMLEVLIGDEVSIITQKTPIHRSSALASVGSIVDPDLPPPPNFNNVIPPTND